MMEKIRKANEISADMNEGELMEKAAAVPRVAVNEQPKPVVVMVQTTQDTSLPLVALPENFKLESAQPFVEKFERLQDSPYRRHGIYYAADVPSLTSWMRTHAPDDAPIFATGLERLNGEWRNPRLALIGIANYSDGQAPNWHDFQGRYDFPISHEWQTWAKFHSPNEEGEEKWFKQSDFAEFIEDHIHEIDDLRSGETASDAVLKFIEASGKNDYAMPGELFQMARELTIFAQSKCEVQFDLQTGEHQVQYSEEHTGKSGRPLKLKQMFFVRIPVFFGQSPVLIGVKLRYHNAGQGNVLFSYSLFAPEIVVADEFKRAIEQVKHEGFTVYLGSPDMP